MTIADKNDPIEVVLGCLGITTLLIAAPFISALGAIYDGYICTRMWAWFIAPYFPLKFVPIVVFVAADFIVLLLFRRRDVDEEDRTTRQLWVRTIGATAIYPSVVWLSAYLIHRWVA